MGAVDLCMGLEKLPVSYVALPTACVVLGYNPFFEVTLPEANDVSVAFESDFDTRVHNIRIDGRL